jgi:hypothetical protein
MRQCFELKNAVGVARLRAHTVALSGVALIMLYTAGVKFNNPIDAIKTIMSLGIPDQFTGGVLAFVIVCEFALGISLIFDPHRRRTQICGTGLLLAFNLVLVRLAILNESKGCGCGISSTVFESGALNRVVDIGRNCILIGILNWKWLRDRQGTIF